jgi:hypothetical protein
MMIGTGSYFFGDNTSGISRIPSTNTLAVAGSGGVGGYVQQQFGDLRLDADFSKSDTTLQNITGSFINLGTTVLAGRTYSFDIALFMTTGASAGGFKVGLGGTATVTSMIADGNCIDGSTVISVVQIGTLTSLVSTTNAGTTPKCFIKGTITVNAGGTFYAQFAENVATGASTVKRGSYMMVKDMP